MRTVGVILLALLVSAGPCVAEDQPASAAALLAQGDKVFRSRDYAKATEIYMRAVAAAEVAKMDGWLGPLWNNLGNTYHEQGRNKEALEAFVKARHYHWKVADEHRKLVADWAVGRAHRKLGQHEKAKQWLRPTLAWAERRYAEKKEPERGEWIGLACMELGLVAKAEGRKESALKYLERAKVLLEAVEMAAWHPAAWKELTEALAALAPNPKSAK